MQPMMMTLAEEMVPAVMFAAMGVVGVAWVIGAYWSEARETREREQSRREIAAYVAEGSMSPADGERLIAAGVKRDEDKKKT